MHEWNPYPDRRKSSSAKKMDETNYTGHVTFKFLVNLVVHVNGISFFSQMKQYHCFQSLVNKTKSSSQVPKRTCSIFFVLQKKRWLDFYTISFLFFLFFFILLKPRSLSEFHCLYCDRYQNNVKNVQPVHIRRPMFLLHLILRLIKQG